MELAVIEVDRKGNGPTEEIVVHVKSWKRVFNGRKMVPRVKITEVSHTVPKGTCQRQYRLMDIARSAK
jgi:23S rRNA maturation-related 3'-5' exoribonuclease YhaM